MTSSNNVSNSRQKEMSRKSSRIPSPLADPARNNLDIANLGYDEEPIGQHNNQAELEQRNEAKPPTG